LILLQVVAVLLGYWRRELPLCGQATIAMGLARGPRERNRNVADVRAQARDRAAAAAAAQEEEDRQAAISARWAR